MDDSNHLWQDILKFSRDKYKLGSGLIVLGILGLLLPVMPGVILVLLGFYLIKPEWFERAKQWFGKSEKG